ncbi:hypothetical protein [Brucella rhizosphaerae]|uniref:hypothetical protein n=1 Tax=Brucella rhizosphaerae TaxID=571254 RepID=UPI000B99CFC9|nr:hypothetical protein [Brucella rhizosphaerae]
MRRSARVICLSDFVEEFAGLVWIRTRINGANQRNIGGDAFMGSWPLSLTAVGSDEGPNDKRSEQLNVAQRSAGRNDG